jgi:PTS system maltose and glucose-specific IIC component
VIFIALKSDKTFYLAVALHPTHNLKIRIRVNDGKNDTKNYLVGVFPAVRKNVYVARGIAFFCGIMLGIGSSLSSHDVLTLLPWLDIPLLQAVFVWMSKVGSFAFSFLPVMFCIAIPLGLARENKGVAAFAGFVGYAVMNLAVNFWLTAKGFSHDRCRGAESQQYPEHHRYSVDRYRDPGGGDRRDHCLDAARAFSQYPPA